MFTLPSMCLLGIDCKSLATVRFPAVSQTGNSVCPLHSHTDEERESVKVSFARPSSDQFFNQAKSGVHLERRFLQNLHRRYHCIS